MNQSLRLILFCSMLFLNDSVTATPKVDFSGHWLDCESYQGAEVCSGYMLRQQGSMVCGMGSSFASGSQYENHLKGEAKDNVLLVRLECGAGSATKCPKFGTPNHAPLLLCGNHFYITRETACNKVVQLKTSRPFRKVSAKKFAQKVGEPEFAICKNVL
ncbi:hypothetical protein ACFQ2T_08265 [Methylophilus flavus]|uniref:Uncharacterized protein n=1 Tax=Methylophilus flavus TaxID=640084 RepID=A0ABW3PFF6_9PROT